MSEKQKETLEWLEELEQYAKERQLPMRILDSIAECRKKVTLENVNWNQICLQIEELLDSVEKKVLPAVVKVEEGDNEVSVAAVENELKNMAQKCHAENEASLNRFENRKNIILQNLFANLQDITRVEAHLKELKEEKSYQVFFRRVETEYRNNILIMIRELLQSICSNHGQMMERMKSMFQSIRAYKHGLGSERLYREYDTRTAALDGRIRNETERLDTGEEEIRNLERKTWENINPIVRKLERKRKMLSWLPPIIMVCVLLAGVISIFTAISQIAETIEESASEENSISQEAVFEWLNKLNEKGVFGGAASADGADMTGEAAASGIAAGGTGIIGIFIFLLTVLIYWLYLLLLKRWCTYQICNKCGAYLNAELADFEKSNTLLPRMNDMINTAMEEFEQQYASMLNELLRGSGFDPERKEKKEADRFTEVKNSWNAIKYK